MSHGKASIFLTFLLLSLAMLAGVAEAREDLVPGSRYTDARAAAMGDAYLPLADDGASALFYNPADLSKIRKTSFELMNLSLYGNNGWVSNFGTNASFYKITSLSAYEPTLTANPGVLAGAGAQYLPSFYTKGFAFGILLNTQVQGIKNLDGSITYRSTYQVIPTIGTGIKLASGIVRIGYSLQMVDEAVGTNTVPSTTTPLGYNQGLAQGTGFSNTVGTTITMPWTYLPAASLVARNIGGVHYSTSSLFHFTPNPTGAPANEVGSYDFALSMQPKIGNGSYFNLVLEDRDFTGTSGMELAGRLAFGMEMSIKDSFFLRGGWGSGYPSAGIGLREKRGEVSFTWYSEEVGQTYHDIRDQRFLFQYSVKAF